VRSADARALQVTEQHGAERIAGQAADEHRRVSQAGEPDRDVQRAAAGTGQAGRSVTGIEEVDDGLADDREGRVLSRLHEGQGSRVQPR
jgi:hypothetical protein